MYTFFVYSLFLLNSFRELTQEYVDEMGIKHLPTYRDPFSDRVMKFGEIGCFLSHYKIWKDVS